MNNKIVLFLLILFFLFFFSSCIEIVNRITFNKDGSGKFSINLDFGPFVFLPDKIKYFNFSLLNNKIIDVSNHISNIKGITNVHYVSDTLKKVFLISFEFKDNKSMNKAIYTLFNQKKTFFKPNFVKFDGEKLFVRNYAPYIKLLKNKITLNQNSNFIKNINLKSVYTLPCELVSTNNPKTNILANKKTIVIKNSLQELFEEDINIGLKAYISCNK